MQQRDGSLIQSTLRTLSSETERGVTPDNLFDLCTAIREYNKDIARDVDRLLSSCITMASNLSSSIATLLSEDNRYHEEQARLAALRAQNAASSGNSGSSSSNSGMANSPSMW